MSAFKEHNEFYPLADSSQTFQSYVVAGLDKVSEGNKAPFLTSVLIFADLAKDRTRLRDLSKEHRDALNEYFDEVDIQKLFVGNNDLVKPATKAFKDSLKSHVPTLFTGAALGVLTLSIINSRKKK